jgi:hypothetical protein
MEYHNKNMRATLLAASIRRAFTDWLRAEGDRLVTTAELLCGDLWKCRATKVLDAIADGADPEQVAADLSDLLGLLTLEWVDEIDSVEAACSMAVHPDDPRADDARICAEALDRGLAAMRQLAEATVPEVA